MKNIISENDFIEYYLENIDSACDDIVSSVNRGDDIQVIECCVRNIRHASDEIYRELECTEILEETVALSVVKDFFGCNGVLQELS